MLTHTLQPETRVLQGSIPKTLPVVDMLASRREIADVCESRLVEDPIAIIERLIARDHKRFIHVAARLQNTTLKEDHYFFLVMPAGFVHGEFRASEVGCVVLITCSSLCRDACLSRSFRDENKSPCGWIIARYTHSKLVIT